LSKHRGHHEVKIGSDRSFAIVFAVIFTVIGILPFTRGGELRLWSVLLAAVLLGLGLIAPRVLRPLNVLWFKFGILLGRIIAPIAVSLLFIVAVTPIALILRISGKDPLSLKLDRNTESYWISRSETENPMSSMKNQF
jgi:hypothetical protein